MSSRTLQRAAVFIVSILVVTSGLTVLSSPAQAVTNPCLPSRATAWPKALGGMFKWVMRITGCERHHMIANSVIPDDGRFPKRSGVAKCIPTIVMKTDDHRLTGSWGNSTYAQWFRSWQKQYVDNGQFREALKMDLWHLSRTMSASDPTRTLAEVYKTAINLAVAAFDKVGGDNNMANLDPDCNVKDTPEAATEPSKAPTAQPAPVTIKVTGDRTHEQPATVEVTVQRPTFGVRVVELTEGFGSIVATEGQGTFTVTRSSTYRDAYVQEGAFMVSARYVADVQYDDATVSESSDWFAHRQYAVICP